MGSIQSVFDSQLFTWVILPLLIFFARILDQSIGTVRLIFLSKGMKLLAPILGFFEVIIWLLAIGQIMQHLDNWLCYIAYGAGFAMGNYIGMAIEERLSLGNSIIRVIISSHFDELIDELNANNYGTTLLDAEGAKGPVKVLFSIIRRKEIGAFIAILNKYNPHAFYTIEEVKAVNEGVFRKSQQNHFLPAMWAKIKKMK